MKNYFLLFPNSKLFVGYGKVGEALDEIRCERGVVLVVFSRFVCY